MIPQLRDFVATYKPPRTPEPFFGFFEVEEPRKRRTNGKYYQNKKKRNAGRLTTGKLQRHGININERFEKYYKNKMTHQEKVKQRAEALAAKAKAPETPIKFLSSKDSQFRRELEAKKPTAPKPITRETKGEKIWKLHESGMTLKEISIEMNMTRNNVGAHLSTERKKIGLII